MLPSRSARRNATHIALLIACAGAAHAGPSPVNEWRLADTGVWSDPARWSLGVAPGLPGALNADARIAATGTPYTVTLNTLAALNNFSLASSNATLSITNAGVLQIAGAATIGDDADPSVGGLLLLNNGSIRGGTWSIVGAGELRVRGNQPSRIEDAAVLGDVLLETGAFLRVGNSSIDRVRMLGNTSILEFEDNAPITGDISFEGAGASLRIVRTTSDDGRIHFGSDAVVETGADFAGRGFIGTPTYSSETIVNDGRITASAGTINIGGATITNNGAMQALNASILTSSASFVNASTIEIHDGLVTIASNDPPTSLGLQNSGAITAVDSTLNIANGVVNTGSIDALRSTIFIDASRLQSSGRFDLVDSTLRVAGEFTFADLTGITRANSTVAIAGSLNNQQQSLDLNALPDRLSLDGGTIRGGVIVASGDAALSVSSDINNTLESVAYSGRLALDQEDAFLRVRNGSTITGRVDMTGRHPELRFDSSMTLDDIHINADATQSYIAAEVPGQTITFGPNSVVDGNNLVNGSRRYSSVFAPFDTIVNEGEFNVRAPWYWQLQSTRRLVNRGTINIDANAELVVSSGIDLAGGLLTVAPEGMLTIIGAAVSGTPFDPSFFDGGLLNQGIVSIGTAVDLRGRSVTLNADHGDIRLGSDFFSGISTEARNGSIHVGEGASLTLDYSFVSLRDLQITGDMAVNPDANATFLNVIADHVRVRGGTSSVAESIFDRTTFEGGTITATDLTDLGRVHLPGFENRTIRLTAQGGGVVDAGEFTFDPGSRLLVESPLTSALVNRTDWNLSPGAQLSLSSGAVVNEADITLAQGAQLRLTGLQPFTNPGSITLNGGTITIANPFEFDELLREGNNLSNGRVVLDRNIDLAGATLFLRGDSGQWALGSRKTLSNGVVDNLEGQPLLLFGTSTSSNPPTRLERVDVKGDIDAMSVVRIGRDVTFRTLTFDDEVIFEQDAAINGMLIQQDNRSVDVRFESSTDGVVRIAETGGITATENLSGRTVRLLGAPNESVLENYGEIAVHRGGRLTSSGVPVLRNYGAIHIDESATLNMQELSLFNFGDIALSSRTDVVIRGDLVLGEGSSIRFELGETDITADGLVATGHTVLDGALEIAVTDDASLAVGDRWEFLRTFSANGFFDSVSFDTLSNPDLRLAMLTSEFPTNPNLEVVVRHIADLNADMAVDMDDLNLVLNGYGESGPLLGGDANTDGLVDFHDLNIVLANFGRTFSPRAVPTPGAAAALVALGLLSFARRRAR